MCKIDDRKPVAINCIGDPLIIQKDQKLPIINFLATADPQYDTSYINPDIGLTLYADSVSAIMKRKLFAEKHEGVILAGDLTHNCRPIEILKYREYIDGYAEHIYDGTGNHDYRQIDGPFIDIQENIDFGLKEFSDFDGPGWDHGSVESWEIIRDRKRATPTNTIHPNIHYSWDWGDIHFVQLNLFAGNEPPPAKPYHDPWFALDFLKEDLAKDLCDPSDPIILIQHYGFDPFSLTLDEEGNPRYKGEWWTEAQRKKMWDFVKDYNVLAIFAGHAHNCTSCETCYLPWDGTNVGIGNVKEPYIHSFISGAAREGMYLSCHIYDDVMHIERYRFEDLVYSYVLPITR